MAGSTDHVSAMRRRTFLARACAGAAGLWPALLHDAPMPMQRRGRAGGNGAMVPATRISLAAFGGTPAAPPARLVAAFGNAFAALTGTGGGTLFVPAGLYDFGHYADASTVILCRDLHDIVISAYGATFRATTTANVMPSLFYFFNFRNITIAGASFTDPGFSPYFNWRGMYCVGIQADRFSSGFRMVDCYAERVVGLFATNNNAAGRRYLSDISVHGEVRHAYYGVGANFIRDQVAVDLVCHNVRRAFIAYTLRRARIRVRAHNASYWPGSNGLIALVAPGGPAGNVEHVCVSVEVSGACIHRSFIHFYHQGNDAAGYMRDIDATVDAGGQAATDNLFLFDHETAGVLPTTPRVWDRIWLHGRGSHIGRVVANPSVSTAPGTVMVDRELAALGKIDGLGAGFRIRPDNPHPACGQQRQGDARCAC